MPTHYPGKPEEIRALNTYIKLLRAAESLKSRLFDRGAFAGLTLTQFGILESLYHLGPLNQSELGAKQLRTGGNITLVVDNLEKQNLVRRERDTQDRRTVIVSLTDTGRTLIADVFPAHVAAIVAEMEILTPEEQEMLAVLCKKLGKQTLES